MYDEQGLSHTKWECKYHIVWIPKYRKKAIFEKLRKHLGKIFRDLAAQKECEVVEGHLLPDHVHILLSIPPKYSVSQVVGFIKGKSAIQIVRNFQGRKKNFVGQHFWARGYYVATVVRLVHTCQHGSLTPFTRICPANTFVAIRLKGK